MLFSIYKDGIDYITVVAGDGHYKSVFELRKLYCRENLLNQKQTKD